MYDGVHENVFAKYWDIDINRPCYFDKSCFDLQFTIICFLLVSNLMSSINFEKSCFDMYLQLSVSFLSQLFKNMNSINVYKDSK